MKLRILFSLFTMLMLVSVQAQVTTVGIIGTATPGGWDADTDMVQDPDSSNLWTLSIDLLDGEAKFRANNAWDINWGSTAFPYGTGEPGGPNIPVPAGHYDITFNSNTGVYYFDDGSDIGIIGSATPHGWDSDINLTQSLVDTNEYSVTLLLGPGEAKFRQNDDWTVNWGATDFPSGIGVQNGPNIPISIGGDYLITFNKSTGAYNFQLVGFSSIGVIGDATPGGWATETAMTSNGPNSWTATLDLVDGGLQFSGNNGAVIFGGTDFPTGVATMGGDTIPVTAGLWVIEFNTQTGVYTFSPLTYYQTVGIIGDATPGGWDNDTDMEHNGSDPSEWRVRITLTDGEAKFRAENDWAVNWGSGDFPTGIAERDGANIPITAGEYNVYFNSFTGAYSFVQIFVYDTVGMVGTATPNASWDLDVFLTKDANDENLWKIASVDLSDGELKFRANANWTVNWGSDTWPTGVGTQDGPNIPVTAGTYGVVFNSASGEYTFGDPLVGTHDLLDPGSIRTYPNPASDVLNIDLSAVPMTGMATFNIYDMNGKLVQSDVKQVNSDMQLQIGGIQSGYYTLQITNDHYIIGKKFVIAK